MPLFLDDGRGKVARLAQPAAGCTVRSLSVDPAVRFEQHNAILTRVTIGEAGNLQLLHSIGGLVYIYGFGDRIGSTTLSGIGFECMCPAADQVGPPLPTSGLALVHGWYRENRAARRKAPVRVTVGDTAIDGYIAEGSFDASDPQTGMSQWTVTAVTIPPNDL